MPRTSRSAWAVLLAVVAVTVGTRVAGLVCLGGRYRDPLKIPGLDRLMNPNNDPITTSIADALTEVPFLDSYNPEQGAGGLVPRGPKGMINMLRACGKAPSRASASMPDVWPTQATGIYTRR